MYNVLLLIFILALFTIVNKLWCFRCKSPVCLTGKTAIVTGAASGIGFQTALALASKGCRIIVADVTNIGQAVDEIKRLSHNSNIVGRKIDLQSFRSVRAFAEEIIDAEPRLDILACNAGIGNFLHSTITDDNLNNVMQINYFSHFLLTHLLLDLLKKSAPSRIIFTSSLAAYWSDLSMDSLNLSTQDMKWYHFLNGGVYSNSKLALAAASKLFGTKLKGTGVTANAVHPGGITTPLFTKVLKTDRIYYGLPFIAFVYLYGKNPEEGAQTLIHLASSDDVANVTGQSFYEGRKWLRPVQLTDQFCQRFWDASIRLTRLEPHEIGC